jgi:16S rRNA (cytosine1402-N4)-methyltransferase
MLREVVRYLDLKPGLRVVDGTVGAGGHSQQIAQMIQPDGVLVGLDRDPMMLQLASRVISESSVYLRQTSYASALHILNELELDNVDRFFVDLGLSSDQLADTSRGFGFDAGGALDLRFDTTDGLPAWKHLAQLDEEQLADILWRYGDERYSRQIARVISGRRRSRPIRTAEHLVEACVEAIPSRAQRAARKHPATRVFQALRIHVNQELQHLQDGLDKVFYEALAVGGRLVVLSFHSLEDRMVKRAFRNREQWEIETSKPITATSAEQKINPRSRTAKLRVATKI